MKKLGKWSIKNNVTVNLVMIFIIVAGVVTVMKMRREMFPQFALDMIFVSVAYPGSSPEEVEEGICIKIEEQIEGIEGIDRIISTAREGRGEVTVELESGTDVQKVLDEIKAEVDRIDTFPEEAEEPLVLEIINRDPTIYIAAYGDVAERSLRQAAEKIRDDLLDARIVSQMNSETGDGIFSAILKKIKFKQPEVITQIELVGVRDYEIAIEVS
ncbi:MAG: efflux RND transporter permease subunit, partial [Desulfobacterales bacterium]